MYQTDDWPAAPLSSALVNQVHCMDALTLLAQMPSESVNCIVTSPPYYGLRNYGVDGQIGLEQTPAAYVARLRDVFREARRVLRADGTLWINLGDSYASTTKGSGGISEKQLSNAGSYHNGNQRLIMDVPEKSLIGIPWRVAFALQDDGWILRQDNIWHKPAPMPESVKDRTTRSHEYVFHFAKSPRYWYDADAVSEKAIGGGGGDFIAAHETVQPAHGGVSRTGRWAHNGNGRAAIATRNRRSVWTIGPEPFAGEHYAAYPSRLPEICIMAGCPPGGLVFDPFMGSGTTALVARRLGRAFVGCDLSPEYVAIARERLAQPFTLPMFAA